MIMLSRKKDILGKLQPCFVIAKKFFNLVSIKRKSNHDGLQLKWEVAIFLIINWHIQFNINFLYFGGLWFIRVTNAIQ